MLDLLIYRESAKIEPNEGPEPWMICGKSCLAGDIFGEFRFPEPLKSGDRLSIQDAAGYTMVKKNWFNGVKMPSIAVRELDGTTRLVRDFGYEEFAAAEQRRSGRYPYRQPDPVEMRGDHRLGARKGVDEAGRRVASPCRERARHRCRRGVDPRDRRADRHQRRAGFREHAGLGGLHRLRRCALPTSLDPSAAIAAPKRASRRSWASGSIRGW